MTLSVLGINHKTASVDFRERVAFSAEKLQAAYTSAKQQGFDNLVILSTCNRTELYYHHSKIAGDNSFQAWFSRFINVPKQEISDHSYSYDDTDMLTHLVRVASGLDSLILGEPQILGQVKQAFTEAQLNQSINKKFAWVFEQVFAATKKVRTDSKLGEQTVSIASAVAKLTEQIFDYLPKKTLLLVASGEMNQLVGRHMCTHGIGKVMVANRSRKKAEDFAVQLKEEYACDVSVIDFSSVEQNLYLADIVCSCTASQHIVIPFKWAKKAIKKRRYQPQLLVDLAVPRDVDAKVSKIDDIYHYTVDDLQDVLSENITKRQQAAVAAEVIVSHEVADIVSKQRLKDISYFIGSYQQNNAMLVSQFQEKAKKRINDGENTIQVLEQTTQQLSAKLNHAYFHLLKSAASQDDPNILAFLVKELTEAKGLLDKKND